MVYGFVADCIDRELFAMCVYCATLGVLSWRMHILLFLQTSRRDLLSAKRLCARSPSKFRTLQLICVNISIGVIEELEYHTGK